MRRSSWLAHFRRQIVPKAFVKLMANQLGCCDKADGTRLYWAQDSAFITVDTRPSWSLYRARVIQRNFTLDITTAPTKLPRNYHYGANRKKKRAEIHAPTILLIYMNSETSPGFPFKFNSGNWGLLNSILMKLGASCLAIENYSVKWMKSWRTTL